MENNYSAAQILATAHDVLAELRERFPQHRDAFAKVHFQTSRRMTSAAGKANCRTGAIKLSEAFFSDPTNAKESLRNTVLHEIAHIVSPPQRGHSAHGRRWRATFVSFGGSGERCHQMKLAQGFKRKERTVVKCGCGRCGREISLGPVQLRRAKAGADYRHRDCEYRRR